MVRTPAHNASSCIWRLNSHATNSRLNSLAAKSRILILHQTFSTKASRSYASAAGVVRSVAAKAPRVVDFVPSKQLPSARPVETRKSQLIRSYTSLLRSSPLILFFQHSNLTAVEWAAVRRELRKALAAVQLPPSGPQPFDIAPLIQLQVLRTNMLDVALKIVEFHDAKPLQDAAPSSGSAAGLLTHDLSLAAYEKVRQTNAPPESAYAQLAPLLIGPIAALVFPAVSPVHLSAALSILAPSPPRFRAPLRKKNPGYHEPICQTGLAKLMLIGGRIEGSVFDHDGINWVGSIEGGIDGLRAQLISMLQSAGAGLTTTLEGGSRSLWLTLESRKCQLEDGAKGIEDKETAGVEK